ncbi:MAG: hypothetical protein LBE83_03150 [Propionibacteriaceae bacterium]|jgi:hypothetical protein|nr:hypothetical protein [Propionibacteriaceae bacterium]
MKKIAVLGLTVLLGLSLTSCSFVFDRLTQGDQGSVTGGADDVDGPTASPFGKAGYTLPESVRIEYTIRTMAAWMDGDCTFIKIGQDYYGKRDNFALQLIDEFYLKFDGTTWAEYSQSTTYSGVHLPWHLLDTVVYNADHSLRGWLAEHYLYFVGSVEDIPEVQQKGKYRGEDTVVGRSTGVWEFGLYGITQTWYIDPVHNITLKVVASVPGVDQVDTWEMVSWDESISGFGDVSLP